MTNPPKLETGTASLEGAELYCEVAGEGPWLVLAHAGIADRTMWDEQFAVFAQHYRVLRYDLRGFGDSPMAPGPFSHRQDLYELLEHFEIKKTHLIGCSNGGQVALDFTLEHPGRITSLILVSSAVSGYEFKGGPPQTLLDLMAALKKRDLDKAAEVAVRIWADGPERTPEQVDPNIREQVKEMSRVALRNQLPDAEQEEGLEPPPIQRLDALNVPTLVVVGGRDDPSILDIGEVLTESIAGAKKVVIPGAAHMLNMEQPEVFNQLALAFLQGTG